MKKNVYDLAYIFLNILVLPILNFDLLNFPAFIGKESNLQPYKYPITNSLSAVSLYAIFPCGKIALFVVTNNIKSDCSDRVIFLCDFHAKKI